MNRSKTKLHIRDANAERMRNPLVGAERMRNPLAGWRARMQSAILGLKAEAETTLPEC
jgi:hypothetical protein